MKNWLKRLATRSKSGQNARRHLSRSKHSTPSEVLEQRTYLSVSSLISNNQLIIVANANDSILVRSDPGGSGRVQLLANGILDPSLPNIQASQIRSIQIDAGSGNNLVDLTQVNSGAFSFVMPGTGARMRISVDGGDGHDTILGSLSFDDVLIGGDGDDIINNGLVVGSGNQTIDGGDGNDTLRGGNGNDSISGRDGADLIVGGAGRDTISGGDNNDTIDGLAGDDSINGNHGEDSIFGGFGNDTISGDSGNDTISGGADNDSLLGGGGDDILGGNDGDDMMLGNSGNDTLLGGQGVDNMSGGDGNDVLDSGERGLSINDVVIGFEGNSGFQNATFTVVLSSQSALTVTVNAATVDGTARAGSDYIGVSQSLTFLPGELTKTVTVQVLGDITPEFDENFFVELTNPINAVLTDSFGIGTIVDDNDGPQQLVFLDFDSATDNFEHFYTTSERNAIQARMAQDFAFFSTNFTQVRPIQGPFSTILINQPPPGGLADEIDFRNLNLGANASVDINGFLGGFGNPPATSQNFVELTAKVAAHELGHLMGLRHNDAIGSGISPGVFAGSFTPNYPGPSGANETNSHISGSPAATGETLFDAVSNQWFGAREAVKLSFWAYAGQVLPETSVQHDTIANPQPISLVDLTVPNTEVAGSLVGQIFDVDATVVTGGIGAPGEIDMYSFTATQGQVLNLEVMSSLFAGAPSQRYPDLINPQVRILDASGNTINYYGGNAVNLDSTDSGFPDPDNLIIDLIIPATGVYFVEVSAELFPDLGSYELYMYTFAATSPLMPVQAGIVISSDGDIMDGGEGSDSLGGGLGNDLLIGGSDNDLVFANLGNDSVYGGSGSDTIDGGAGNDVINGQGGTDFLEGGADDDFVDGGSSFDIVYGDDSLGNTTGNDTVVGGTQNDSVFGGAGNDFLFGGGGNDTLDGGLGDDTIFGQAGNDLVRGGGGVDVLNWSGDGNDIFESTGGLETVVVGATNGSDTYTVGQDGTTLQISTGGKTLSIPNVEGDLASPIEQIVLNMGAGDDNVSIGDVSNVGAAVLIVNGEDGSDLISGAGGTLGNVRLVIDGGAGDDVLIGTTSNDTIVGGDGNDVISSRQGNDTVNGGAGDDVINGGSGDDFVMGDADNDNITGGDGNDTLDGGFGNDVMNGDNGRDSMIGGFGDDLMIGGNDNDFLSGDTGEDTLVGAGGNDTLDGGRNNDVLLGNSGNDKLRGDHGDDTIVAHRGDDTIDGGDGNDLIMAGEGNDGIVGGDGNDFITGDEGNDIITGNDGHDSLLGGSGIDIILGGDGDDVIGGNAGNDTLSGGEGSNSIFDPVAIRDEKFMLTPELLAKLDASN